VHVARAFYICEEGGVAEDVGKRVGQGENEIDASGRLIFKNRG
jgi:hypothetical protein